MAQVGAETTTQGAVILLKAIILYHTPLNFSSFEYQGIFAPFFQTKGVYKMKKRKDGRYQRTSISDEMKTVNESTNPYVAHHEKRLKRLPPN